ncbi:arylsulfatase B-like [Pecten maximus]|uniref:arylsulfatase B-like n=1 Tax=Pecten maximus TaxID=6579 RepID=UPI001458ACF9|nr:arylsulfatase B-like [Pecten maximus]
MECQTKVSVQFRAALLQAEMHMNNVQMDLHQYLSHRRRRHHRQQRRRYWSRSWLSPERRRHLSLYFPMFRYLAFLAVHEPPQVPRRHKDRYCMLTLKTRTNELTQHFLLYEYCRNKTASHILFVLADDYGYNDIGYHGSEIKTPTLDKLSGEGVRLENYYVQPICTPTRSQLMSGRYQIHTGLQHHVILPDQPNALPRDSPTLPDKMREAGYSTHAVGKWHLGFYKEEYLPNNRGFDTFFGYLTGSEDYYTKRHCFGQNVCGNDLRDNFKPVVPNPDEYSTEMYSKRVIDIVNNYNSSKPMFIYLAFQAVHGPLEVPARYKNKYTFIKDHNRQIYAGMVAAMDEAVGNITAAFQAKGIWDDTIMVFSTDNGGQIKNGGNNWPLRGWKKSLWEGGIHGVGFVHGKALQEKRRVSHELLHVTDWYPTLVGLAGGSLNGTKPLDGFNQWKTISEGAKSPRETLLHNIDPLTKPVGDKLKGSPFDNRYRAAIRWRDWKLITGDPGNGTWVPVPTTMEDINMGDDTSQSKKNLWLFNIAKDPEERVDLSSDYPDMVMKMLTKLQQQNETAVPCVYPPADPNANPERLGGWWGPWEK